MKRLFIVGCPRSGTTLLQAALAAHPSLVTVPETHFAQKIRGRLPEGRKVVWPRAGNLQVARLAAHLQTDPPGMPSWAVTPGAYHRAFRQLMDEYARRQGANGWIEKSPVHLHYLPELEANYPDAEFVHIVRDGRAVCASLWELAHRDPTTWLRQLDRRWASDYDRVTGAEVLRASARRWNRDVSLTRGAIASHRHHLVVYEELTIDPDAILANLQRALGLEVARLDHADVAKAVIGHRGSRPHMRAVTGPMGAPSLAKFDQVLTSEEQAQLVGALVAGGEPRVAVAGGGDK